MLSIIKDASIRGIQNEIAIALVVANDIFSENGKPCIVTSCTDGEHSRGSLHYVGAAVDLRSRHLTTTEKDNILADLRESLGQEFDVVLEKTHFHIEFQPKNRL